MENATAEFLKPKGMREGPCANLVERSAASEKSMHSTIVLLMRSSPAIRSKGLGGRVEARMLGILREREREMADLLGKQRDNPWVENLSRQSRFDGS